MLCGSIFNSRSVSCSGSMMALSRHAIHMLSIQMPVARHWLDMLDMLWIHMTLVASTGLKTSCCRQLLPCW